MGSPNTTTTEHNTQEQHREFSSPTKKSHHALLRWLQQSNSSGVPQVLSIGIGIGIETESGRSSCWATTTAQRSPNRISFSCQLPSLIAAASIATAVHGLQSTHKPSKCFDAFVSSLSTILNIDSSRIKSCVHQIESLITSRTPLVHQFVPKDTTNYDQIFKYQRLSTHLLVVLSRIPEFGQIFKNILHPRTTTFVRFVH
ncbi:unnamed protein product [Oppiella nova]|uniref:Cyclin C-terminal domain-containing protein n=1 Tax=Oppiella nova TaxID=334625 RepID=A0A7R9QFJ8_9ACAR|nr:unnamed protein product [Oppiella nova]CAG2164915.1 unnamed protein product [Oppiella nova]